MWFGEPHSFPERGSPTGLSNVGTLKLKKNDHVETTTQVCIPDSSSCAVKSDI
jgi:hypothetical protein